MIEERVERVSDAFAHSPKKSVWRASRELAIPVMSAWRILQRRLQIRPYRLQLLQALKPTDYGARAELGYRLDVCRVTKGAHIVHLQDKLFELLVHLMYNLDDKVSVTNSTKL